MAKEWPPDINDGIDHCPTSHSAAATTLAPVPDNLTACDKAGFANVTSEGGMVECENSKQEAIYRDANNSANKPVMSETDSSNNQCDFKSLCENTTAADVSECQSHSPTSFVSRLANILLVLCRELSHEAAGDQTINSTTEMNSEKNNQPGNEPVNEKRNRPSKEPMDAVPAKKLTITRTDPTTYLEAVPIPRSLGAGKSSFFNIISSFYRDLMASRTCCLYPPSPMDPNSSGFKRAPTLNDRIHCVCFVIDSSTAAISAMVLPEKIVERIVEFGIKEHHENMREKLKKECGRVQNMIGSGRVRKAAQIHCGHDVNSVKCTNNKHVVIDEQCRSRDRGGGNVTIYVSLPSSPFHFLFYSFLSDSEILICYLRCNIIWYVEEANIQASAISVLNDVRNGTDLETASVRRQGNVQTAALSGMTEIMSPEKECPYRQQCLSVSQWISFGISSGRNLVIDIIVGEKNVFQPKQPELDSIVVQQQTVGITELDTVTNTDSSVENNKEKTDESTSDDPGEDLNKRSRYKDCLISDLFGQLQMKNLCNDMNRLTRAIKNMLEKLDGVHLHQNNRSKSTKPLLKNHGNKNVPKGSSFGVLKQRMHIKSVQERNLKRKMKTAKPPTELTSKVCEKSEIVSKLVSISSNMPDARRCQQALIKVFFNDPFMRKELMKCMRMRRDVRNFELVRLLVFRLRAPTLMVQDRNLKVFMEEPVINTILQAMSTGYTRHGAFKQHSLKKPLGKRDVKRKSGVKEFEERTLKKDEFDVNAFRKVSNEILIQRILEVWHKLCLKPNRCMDVDVGECFVKETSTDTALYEPHCFKDLDVTDCKPKTFRDTEGKIDSGIDYDDLLLIPLKGSHGLGASVPMYLDIDTVEKAEKTFPSFSLNHSADFDIDAVETIQVRDLSDDETAEEDVIEPLPEPSALPSTADIVLLKPEQKQVMVNHVVPPRQSENAEEIGQLCREYIPKQVKRSIKSKGSPLKPRKSSDRGGAYTEDDLKASIRDHTWLPIDKLPPPSIDLTTITVANVTYAGLDPIFRGMALGENIGPATTMKYELLRLCTFRNYPKEDKPYLIRLAAAGFYYAADGDQVVCYCCGVRRHGWSGNEVPEVVHRRLTPRCSFLERNSEVNFPVPKDSQEETQRFALLQEFVAPTLDEGQDFVRDNGQQYRQYQFRTSEKPVDTSNSRMTTTELGIDTQTPKHPHYAIKATRENSYVGWPESSNQDPKVMAEAGFYFAGIGDCVRCFQCGVGLRHWAAEDNPWIEHARWGQTCQYLKQFKGEEFINLVQMAVQITQDEESNPSGGPTSDSVLMTDAAQSVIEMGYSTSIIRRAVEILLRNNSRAEVTAAKLMEKVLELEEADNAAHEREMQAKARQTTTTSSSRESSLNVSNAVVSGGVSRQAGTGGKTGFSQSTESSKPAAGATPGEDPKKIKAENDKLKEQTLCKICMDKTVCIVFLPCGHLVTCAECAPSLRKCPICRALVKGTVKTYMS